jgi:hypothetical protein
MCGIDGIFFYSMISIADFTQQITQIPTKDRMVVRGFVMAVDGGIST